jgi:hypothetical protein
VTGTVVGVAAGVVMACGVTGVGDGIGVTEFGVAGVVNGVVASGVGVAGVVVVVVVVAVGVEEVGSAFPSSELGRGLTTGEIVFLI